MTLSDPPPAPSPRGALSAGQRVGNYVVEAKIGEGGMAHVYRARHATLGTMHALKVLAPGLREAPQARARFLDEGRIQANLRHPGIVRVTDTVATPEVAALVCEYVDGPSLETLIDDRRVLPPVDQLRGLLLPILDAVGAAHAQGIIHRDLKPANVLLARGPDGGVVPKVADFGIAKIADAAALSSAPRATREDARLGTLTYMSPEQLRSARDATPRSDIFSLGVLAYELAAGQPPFDGPSDYEVMERIVHGRFVPLAQRRPDLPSPLVSAIERAMSPDPASRFPTCEAFQAALGADAGAHGTTSASPAEPLPRERSPSVIHQVPRPPASPPRVLERLDVEAIRVGCERTFAERVAQHPLAAPLAARLVPADDKDVRRQLMAQSLRLTDSMAPQAYALAREAARVLGVPGELELYQRSGPENAAMHQVRDPILLEIHGSLLSRLDEPALRAVFGHELGHYLAHGPTSPYARMHGVSRVLGRVELEPRLELALAKLSMAAELTADRLGLLACQDLHAALRLEMATVTGLSSSELTWDTDAYLAQCRDVIERGLVEGGDVYAGTHPEHNLRSYALWLFSETRTYQELTGKGPGTRALADVDAILARCLGSAEDAATGAPALDHSRTGEPPRELHECALAAAVIVAFADGELSDEESGAIEKIFAPLVADWRSYLDPELAVERFHETAPVVAAGGPDLARALFHLLVHVMGADGAIDAREVELIIAVGRVVGAEAEYRRYLSVLFATLRVDLGVQEVAVADLPMPPRRRDVEDALEAFLRGVVRRGEATITLRRLLRLLGSDRRTDDHVARLVKAFRRHGIESSTEVTTAALDERLDLAVRATARAPERPRAVIDDVSRAALISALRRLREQLVSGDGRSPSVRLRQPRRGRAFDLAELDKVSVGMSERVLAQVRAAKVVRVVDAADAGRHSSAAAVAAELLALSREVAERFEETGAHDLYVGYPFLTGNVAGYTVRAPLVLYPVDLERDGAGARGYRLRPRPDEPAVANQSLIRLVFNKRGFAYGDELSDELEQLAGDPAGGPEAVRRRLAEVGLVTTHQDGPLLPFRDRDVELLERGELLEVEEVAVLGMFPQSSSDLLQDYDGLLQELARPDVELSSVLGAAATLLPERLLGGAAPVGPGPAADPSWTPVIPADPSQRSVIAACRQQTATVVDGPPGTGKSQVIVNLVAEALRRGERVAVVCEKRAALDVVHQRLTAIGFAKALAVVHDVHEDRKPLYAHLAARLEQKDRIPFDAAEAERVRGEHERVAHALELRASALRTRPAGLELSLGELLAFAACQDPRDPSFGGGLDQVAQSSLRELLDLAVALQPLADVWGPASPWRAPAGVAPRPLLASTSPAFLDEHTRALEGALAAARTYEAAARATPVSPEDVDRARPALGVAVEARGLRASEEDRRLFGAILPLAATDPARLLATDEARAAWDDGRTAMVKLDRAVAFTPTPALVAALAVLRRLGGAWYRFLAPSWWRARAALRRELAQVWPEQAGAAATPALVQDIADRIAASRAWSAIGGALDRLGLRPLLPTTASAVGPLVERVSRLAPAMRELGAARPQLVAVAAWAPDVASDPDALARWDATVDERVRLLGARDALRAAAAPLCAAFPWLQALPAAATLEPLLHAWRRDASRLAEADALLARARAILPTADALLDLVLARRGDEPAAGWRAAISGAWAAAWQARVEREHPGLAQLGTGADDRERDRLAARLAELEHERRELEIERTLARIDEAELLRIEAAEKHKRRTPAQKLREDLLKETTKRRMLMPLRTFVRRFAPHGLLGVAPVWLLSPETMAILFPREPLFDLVVFDEASQCTVEAGLPVLLRARRVVVAGDEKQMPPSSYFSLGGADDEEPDSDSSGPTRAPVADDAQRDLRDLLGAESLLSLARPRVAHAGLAWHYRCRDEALIAFSNHAMYQGNLLTIPSTAGASAPSALRWVSVPDGAYHGGENKPEAERVVDVVGELLARAPRPTIGVVTFNLKQRKAVLDAVDARVAADPAFAAGWTEAVAHESLDERPFVKNLEQVQGDERDVIVFSLGHAPQSRRRKGALTDEAYVPARFGPLGQRGGERRLNVAISRAKQACYVVASFEPAQLSVASSRHEGPRLFKQFLEFAHHMHGGRRVEATRILDLVREAVHVPAHARVRLPIEGYVPLSTQLALALEQAGIPHDLDVGASTFRVPVAVLDPADPARYALAILIDDATTGGDAFDLHVHRPGVLRQRGWKVLSISAASWRRRAPEILAEIEAAVPGCRGAATSELYARHRARTQHTAIAAPITAPAPSAPTSSAPAPDVPAWARAIEDGLYRQALMHLDRHGTLGEIDLANLVGGARRARLFIAQLATWAPTLPFRVEVTETNSGKLLRKA